MKIDRQRLIEAFKIYLTYDQKSDVSFKNPFDKDVISKMNYDCEKLADIAINRIQNGRI